MNNEIKLIRKPSDRCFEETMRREADADNNNNVSTNLPNLIRATFSDYKTTDLNFSHTINFNTFNPIGS